MFVMRRGIHVRQHTRVCVTLVWINNEELIFFGYLWYAAVAQVVAHLPVVTPGFLEAPSWNSTCNLCYAPLVALRAYDLCTIKSS